MHVAFSATGPLGTMVGNEWLLLDLPTQTTIRTALVAACEQLGNQAMKRLLNDDGELQRGILLFLNNKLVPQNGGDRTLKEGDELTVLISTAEGR
jgi:hypothetical protein